MLNPGNSSIGGTTPAGRLFAVVSVGSTSVHLLVARAAPEQNAATGSPIHVIRGGSVDARRAEAGDPSMPVIPGTRLRLIPVADASELLGIGSAVDAAGALADDTFRELRALLQHYVDVARGIGAQDVAVVATEPLRRASNAAGTADELGRLPGVTIDVIDHAEEALLALLAAGAERLGRRAASGAPPSSSATVSARRRATGEHLAVLDIGGGSTEWAFVRAGRAPRVGTLPVGAARLTDAVAPQDPPGPSGIAALRDAATSAARALPRFRPTMVIVLGGTASNLERVALDSMADGRPSVTSGLSHASPGELDRPSLDALLRLLAREPADRLAWAHGIRPQRARILPAGAALLAACLERWSWPPASVSEASIREGTLVAVALAGDRWRAALPSLVASLGAGSSR